MRSRPASPGGSGSGRGGRSRAAGRALTIGALSRATGIPVETLRTWERRYGAPRPVRKPSGHRLYPAEAVEHLRRVGRLLARGHRPAEVLPLSARELEALLSLGEPGTGSPPGAPPSRPPAESVEDLLRAAAEFDRAGLLAELHASWVRLGAPAFFDQVAGPFLVAVGRAWEAGTLQVRHEHFASACLSDFLRAVREASEPRARGPGVALALLPDEVHEGGLRMVAALLALRGHRVLYLGADTPVEEIASAARANGVEAVAISVPTASSRARAARASRDLARLREALPERLPLWVGGAGAPRASARGVERFSSLAELDARLTPFP